MSSFTGFEILPLTPDEGDYSYNNSIDNNEEDYDPLDGTTTCNWIDDSECQENLFQIVPLMPEETTIDKDNHIHTHFKLFFEELGYLTEEPEPIDPTRDYDAEARQMLEERDRTRQKHVHVSRMPSLSYSGVSSTSSSFHHQECDVRSPLYMGHTGADNNHHFYQQQQHHTPYQPAHHHLLVHHHHPSSNHHHYHHQQQQHNHGHHHVPHHHPSPLHHTTTAPYVHSSPFSTYHHTHHPLAVTQDHSSHCSSSNNTTTSSNRHPPHIPHHA